MHMIDDHIIYYEDILTEENEKEIMKRILNNTYEIKKEYFCPKLKELYEKALLLKK